MQGLLWAFSSGAFSSAFWPTLPPIWSLICLLSLSLPGLGYPRSNPASPGPFPLCARLLIALFLGALWATIWGLSALRSELPVALDKRDYLVRGTVEGLPSRDARRIKFRLQVSHIDAVGDQHSSASTTTGIDVPPLKTLSLSWYGGESVVPGQQWQFVVRLRHPRGFANPGGFDYRAWLFRQGISATGYVRKSADNFKLPNADGRSVDTFRYRIAQAIQQVPLDGDARALLSALSIGDKQGISPQTWLRLQRTGTVHLAVISGLHIGLAALVGTLLGYGLGRVVLLNSHLLLPRQAGVLLGWVTALIYAGLAGFSLPTLRAFVMFSVFALMYLTRRNASPFTSLLWAWAVVSVVEPLAMLTAGFWLSFTAVAVLMAYFRARPQPQKSYWSRFRQLILAQWVLLLGMAGSLVFFLGELSLLMPLVNLWAVPWIGFLVVPLCLLGVGLFVVHEPWADFCWLLAGRQLEWFNAAIGELSTGQQWLWTPGLPGGLLLMSALIGAGLLLLSPRGLKIRRFGVLMVAAVVLADAVGDKRSSGAPLALTVLDVGQGLAVVVETHEGVLVYDTGASFSDRFDIGSGVIVPYLRYLGRTDLRMLIVSHSDRDHSGGVEGLLRYHQPEHLLRGSPVSVANPGRGGVKTEEIVQRQCRRGMNWRWGEVSFEVLHPEGSPTGKRGEGGRQRARRKPQNNNSCVVLIRYRDQSILLTGDIEKKVEWRLLKSGGLSEEITVLIAPHHGSKSSSSTAFVRRLSPRHVVYSTAYNHHFGHPHNTVVSRYAAVVARQWNTATMGALRFQWDAEGALAVSGARQRTRHYWQDHREAEGRMPGNYQKGEQAQGLSHFEP